MIKVLPKRIGLFTTFCYCIGILFIAYLLISLPQDLKNLTLGLPLNVVDQLDPMFNRLNISIAVVLTLGMTSLLLLLFNDKNSTDINQFNISESAHTKSEAADNTQQEEETERDEIFQQAYQIISESNDLIFASNKILSLLCKEFEACQGAIYKTTSENDQKYVELISSFAYPVADDVEIKFEFGEGLVGQAAKEGKIINIDSVPEGYINILSGLGSSSPTNLIILPILGDGAVIGIAEIASFKKFRKKDEDILIQIFTKLASVFKDGSDTSMKTITSTVR